MVAGFEHAFAGSSTRTDRPSHPDTMDMAATALTNPESANSNDLFDSIFEVGASDGVMGGDSEAERVRKENAQALRSSLQFMRPGMFQRVWQLRVHLEPQRHLMSWFIQFIGGKWIRPNCTGLSRQVPGNTDPFL